MLQEQRVRVVAVWTALVALLLAASTTAALTLEDDWSLAESFLAVLGKFGGGGGRSLSDVSTTTHLFVVLSGFGGLVLRAIVLGLVLDFILRVRLPMLYASKGKAMNDHVILCGLSRIGMRTLEELEKLDQEVIVIETSEASEFVARVADRKIPMIFGSLPNADLLTEAGIDRARAIVVCTDDDLVNLETALDARSARPDVRIVARLFDQDLAAKVAKGFDIQVAFSSSALAAPAFATAAVDTAVRGSFYVHGRPYVSCKLHVPEGSPLVGHTVAHVRENYDSDVLLFRSPDGEESWSPKADDVIEGDSIIYVAGPFSDVQRLEHEQGLSAR